MKGMKGMKAIKLVKVGDADVFQDLPPVAYMDRGIVVAGKSLCGKRLAREMRDALYSIPLSDVEKHLSQLRPLWKAATSGHSEKRWRCCKMNFFSFQYE